ncbi:sigma-70 family RNA polymerase sigma factor [Microbispora bryophytorum]|uniref:DNA-directed RNA polymerase sigma-70 factor n=1 Tax=Microbispora bryophytorum TaxID=1460882 RepID=A0A8H9H208_9ACTN|nr:sigma-70 family RNA polymerase sigma factor [Microbispora bryophytorum]TQS06722.1 sigma-70 family RNA polymerase sigma factor [Microbispora bryophytorum]GGO07703.1 DNA-directed RNA polymerase sigma-70 factor [Microbispora bryophytorum]
MILVDSTETERFDTGRFEADRFEAGRNRLAALAYRLLGSAADAEDAVQDAFLHWQAADRQRIKVPEAWLTRVVTNLCLDRLRSARARRERAAGAWLPEPLLDGDPMLGPADSFEQRESVSLAVLTLMERLSPLERAVYVLREAFSHSHAEIAEILDITESASQQHLHRARRRITATRRGGEVDPASARRVVEEFLAAAASGHTERLVALLTDDATAVSDGAGQAEKLLWYDTPQRIAAVVRAGFKPTPAKRRVAGGTPAIHYALVNGAPAILFVIDDRVVLAMTFDITGGKIASVRGIAAPTLLVRLTETWRQHDPDPPLISQW